MENLQNNTGSNKLATAKKKKKKKLEVKTLNKNYDRFTQILCRTQIYQFALVQFLHCEAELYYFSMREDIMALLHKPQLLFDVFSFFGARGKPHGLGLSPPSPPPSPLLTQLAYGFQHTLTKGWASSPSRNDTETWIYLQIIYQESCESFVREQSQRAAVHTTLHVTPLRMGNRELANM